MAEITYGELFEEFCAWNPILAHKIDDYRPWGSTSIVIWLNNGFTYKVKRYAPNRFIMQAVSQDDINKKFGWNK